MAEEDALVWAARAGLLTAPEATALREHVARCPAAGTELLAGLRSLRTLVADAVGGPGRPRTADVQPVVLEALAHSHLTPVEGTAAAGAHRWQVRELDEHTLRRRLVLDLLDLLTAPHGRLGTCADPACGWVFLDTSRARSRQWCSSDCGNRNRNRVRQHQRRRASATGAGRPDPGGTG